MAEIEKTEKITVNLGTRYTGTLADAQFTGQPLVVFNVRDLRHQVARDRVTPSIAF